MIFYRLILVYIPDEPGARARARFGAGTVVRARFWVKARVWAWKITEKNAQVLLFLVKAPTSSFLPLK